MLFSVGDRLLHPLHGAGTITEISVKKQGQCYYALHLVLDDVVLYIPVQNSEQVGLRPICSKQQAQRILQGEIGPLPDQSPRWNERYRQNMERLRSGDIVQVAQLVCCLHIRNRRRTLAGSEKRMLECAERILYSELMLASGLSYDCVQKQLEQLWQKQR